MRLVEPTQEEMIAIEQLYHQAFPPDERKPFAMIQEKVKQGTMEMFSIKKEKKFFGFVITIVGTQLVLVDYLAIASGSRGSGVGSTTLTLLSQRYPDKGIMLEIEQEDPTADNNEQRIRRKQFYLRNGYQPAGLYVRLFGVDMEVLTIQTMGVTFEQYFSLLSHVIGQTRAKENVILIRQEGQ